MLIERENDERPLISFSSRWDILGPFQIGTREASWGADPLESLGGFRNLQYDAKTKYPSSLASDGQATWSSQLLASSSGRYSTTEATLTVGFPSVDWPFLQSVYGWAALQYQAWARGSITVKPGFPQSVLLYADNALEFWVNDKHCFGGDFYAYRNAPLVLHLAPGSHILDIRLIRDVRAMGGNGDPNVSIKLKAEGSDATLATMAKRILVSDVVNESLASPFASMIIRNDGEYPIQVSGVASQSSTVATAMIEKSPLRLLPGQSRPLAFRIFARGPLPVSMALEVTYTLCDFPGTFLRITVDHAFARRDSHSPHKYTFLHPSGIVSYAILRAPSSKVCSEAGHKQDLPILLNLHGAGLDADGHQVRHTLDAVPDLPSWVLFSTGVTPWSADDWHNWGFADVEAGAAAIMDWIKAVGWEGPSVSTMRWLVSGHSNGGQGSWYALTHRPDKVIGAAPVSGYSSIQNYVSYQMWKEVDSRVTFLLQNSLQSFRHELLVRNFEGIPILQQHGGGDDNVPAYHSRRMSQLITQADSTASAAYVELKDKGHWFDGAMSTLPLRKFYAAILSPPAELPALPLCFSIVIANPADMGSRGGLKVDQLSIPHQLGKIDVSRSTSTWTMTTSNISRFHFESGRSFALPLDIMVDQDCLEMSPNEEISDCWVVRSLSGHWQISHDLNWLIEERHGAQLGPLDAILRSPGPFSIRQLSTEASEVALQLSRNLFQYFSADTEIVSEADVGKSAAGNIISVAMGVDFPPSVRPRFPIDLTENQGLEIRQSSDKMTLFGFQEGLGAIFLRPLPNERLELVVWGIDSLGLRLAARLLPMLTGVGQPDFVIVSKRCAWEGASGVLAMGSFDNFWNISESSFVS